MKPMLLLYLIFTFNVSAQNQDDAQAQLKKINIKATTISLLQYAAAGDLTTVKLLLDSGMNIDSMDVDFGATALHNAAALGHLKTVKWLIENNANTSIKDKQGNTPLSWAKYHNRKKVVGFLTAQKSKNETTITATILNYLNEGSDYKITPPQSSFHDWKQADIEAQTIIEDWKTTALTIPWTKLQLNRYIKHKIMPGKSARGLALTHVAMYDALVLAKEKNIDSQIAVSTAVSEVLAYIFPAEEKAFKRTVFAIASIKYKVEKTKLPISVKQAMKLGKLVAIKVIKRAQDDGAQRGWSGTRLQWYGEGRYYGLGSWEPTPPYFYYPPEEPYAPTWKTWVLESGSQFRPPAPPLYGSDNFIAALKEVLEIDKNLTKEQLKAAEFWVDGHGTVTPAGHWNQIAMKYNSESKFDGQFNDLKTAKLFAQLNITLADTYIAAWDTKYHYWSIRPVTAAKKLLNVKFKPAILTPPFPSYVSGHAATSGAASQILAHYFPQSANEIVQMGNDAAMSRLYGGIHYRFDNDTGLTQGRKVAELVLTQFNQTHEES